MVSNILNNNLFVLVQGDCEDVKICDFGVTVPLNDRLVGADAHAQYVGTEAWSSKEVLEGENALTPCRPLARFQGLGGKIRL